MDLPPALAPWAPYLDLFPRELGCALGPMVRRLDRALGPLRISRQADEGDPDGFAGITRRGPYDRLLLSEWLLAEEAPAEFTRRAVMSEHAFLQLARSEPAAARVSVALFDAGPEQLGSPRIVHLAALLVLARRAEAAGVPFYWGVMQQWDPAPGQEEAPDAPKALSPGETEIPLHSGVTHAGIRHLLSARSPYRVTDPCLAAWREQLGSSIGADDLWIVGGRRLAALPSSRGAALLQLWDAVEPGVREVRAAVEGSTLGAEFALELPEEPACARLLRDPFASSVAEAVRRGARYVPCSNLLFTGGIRRVITRGRGNSVITYPIPGTPRDSAGKPKQYRVKGSGAIIAAGQFGKVVLVVLATDRPNVLALECVSGNEGRLSSGAYSGADHVVFTAPSSELLPCQVSPVWHETKGDLLFLDAAGKLVRLARAGSLHCSAGVEADGVLAMAPLAHGVVYVARRDSRYVVVLAAGDGKELVYPLGDECLRAFFGYGGPLAHPRYGLLILESSAGQWTVLHARGRSSFVAPSGTTVVGVAASQDGEDGRTGPALVVLESDERTLSLLAQTWSHSLPPASADIAHAAVSSMSPHVAYSTVRGEVVIYSLVHQAVVYRMTGEEAP